MLDPRRMWPQALLGVALKALGDFWGFPGKLRSTSYSGRGTHAPARLAESHQEWPPGPLNTAWEAYPQIITAGGEGDDW